jgi:3-oxoacyl-[acyl-carrier-protein] synthase-3
LAEAAGKGLIERGDLMVLEGIGGGLTWGAALARF